MATVVKNFRIKSGLIVEGNTGTIGGQNILTETGGDSYILNLVGGATLVKSVDSMLTVDGSGKLTINANTYDAYGSASAAQTAAESFATTAANNAQSAAEATAASDATNKANTAKSEAISAAATDATTKANAAQAAAESTAALDATSKANAAQAAAEATASADATSKANAAQAAAEGYADNKINDASSASDKVWSAYKTSTEIGLAQAAAEQHADEAVAALVGLAPSTLDTIEELATALENNPDIIANLESVAAGKQDALTPGSNIDITGSTISVTGLDSADISDFNTAALSATSEAYDAAGSASAAQSAAETFATNAANAADTSARGYADSLASNYDAAGSASAAQSAAATYTDGQISNLTDGGNGFTNLNIDDVVAQRAALSEGLPAMLNEVFTWSASNYRSAKVLVKVANGVHTQISELMVTLDTSNNVAVSEYGITYSNGTELAAVTADYLSGNVRILATPANANTDVMVLVTLI
jgi:hypothetical protein